MKPEYANLKQRVEGGWTDILDRAAMLLVDDAPTCGIGVVGAQGQLLALLRLAAVRDEKMLASMNPQQSAG